MLWNLHRSLHTSSSCPLYPDTHHTLTMLRHQCHPLVYQKETMEMAMCEQMLWHRYVPALFRYIDECTVSIININNGIKEPTCWYQNCNTNQISIFGGYIKVRESLYPSYYLDQYHENTIQNHIDTVAILPGYEGSCMEYWTEWYQKRKYHQVPITYWY